MELFVKGLIESEDDLGAQTKASVHCLQGLLVGFNNTAYGNRLIKEVAELTKKPRGDIPPQLRAMAELICIDPSHIGFSNAADHLKALIAQGAPGFADLHIDYRKELDDLIKLKNYDCPQIGFEEISRRRSRTYPKPPRRALSTIHKSKGLEANHVLVFACDGTHFPETVVKRNLLYVALSRASTSITVVASRNNSSPLLMPYDACCLEAPGELQFSLTKNAIEYAHRPRVTAKNAVTRVKTGCKAPLILAPPKVSSSDEHIMGVSFWRNIHNADSQMWLLHSQ